MIIHKKKWFYFTVLLVPIVVFLFLFGSFFPFSPIIIGFKCKQFFKARIYYHKNENISGFAFIDTLIAETENFHQISFKKPVQIVVCGSDMEMKRLATMRTRMATFPGYGRIFISHKAKAEADSGIISLRIYIKHELSHSLIAQNSSIIHYFRYPNWLIEGIAMVNAKQMGHGWYPSTEETRRLIKNGIFIEPDDYDSPILWTKKYIREMKLPNRTAFFYSEFGCIIEDIIDKYGKDTFILFLKELIINGNAETSFKNQYGITIKKYIENFKYRAINN
jgi:hypothetical protein